MAEWPSQDVCQLIYGQKGFQTNSVKWDYFLISERALVHNSQDRRLARRSFSRGATKPIQSEEKSSL